MTLTSGASYLWCLQTSGSLATKWVKNSSSSYLKHVKFLLLQYLWSNEETKPFQRRLQQHDDWFQVNFCVSVTTKERMWRIPAQRQLFSSGLRQICSYLFAIAEDTYLLREACFANSDTAGCYTHTHTHTHTLLHRTSHTNMGLWHTLSILSYKYVKHTHTHTLTQTHAEMSHTFTLLYKQTHTHVHTRFFRGPENNPSLTISLWFTTRNLSKKISYSPSVISAQLESSQPVKTG